MVAEPVVRDVTEQPVAKAPPIDIVRFEEAAESFQRRLVDADVLGFEYLGEHGTTKAATEHRCVRQDPLRQRVQCIDLGSHRSLQRRRHRVEGTQLADHADELADEQRVAARPLYDLIDLVRTQRRRLGGGDRQQPGRPVVERLQLDAGGTFGVRPAELVAPGHDDGPRPRGGLPCEALDELS